MHVLPPPPPEMQLLKDTAPELISPAYFRKACLAYGNWLIACGVPVDQLQDPAVFVTDADLERFLDVVSKWPRAVTARRFERPTLDSMLMNLRTSPGNQRFTFAARLDWYQRQIVQWMEQHKVDPDHPNETAAERKARLNRERVRAHRQRNAAPKSDDPTEERLTEAVRQLALSVQTGRTWVKTCEADAKRVRDAAVEAAKAHCASTISAGRAAVAAEVHKLGQAQAALDEYKSRS